MSQDITEEKMKEFIKLAKELVDDGAANRFMWKHTESEEEYSSTIRAMRIIASTKLVTWQGPTGARVPVPMGDAVRAWLHYQKATLGARSYGGCPANIQEEG